MLSATIALIIFSGFYMRFLKLKRTTYRADGTANRTALVVDSPRRFAPDSSRATKVMSKKKCQLITGAHDSGKSRWLDRIHAAHFEVYGTKAATPIYLSALQPISSWTDCQHAQSWHDEQVQQGKCYSVTPWRSLNIHQRADRLADYLAENNAILYIDDAHKLTGRKCQIARSCMMGCKRWLIATSDENRLPPNIRTLVERKDPQRTKLESQASYDSTAIFMWFLAALLAIGGAWEVAAVLAGMQALGTGRRSARAD